MDLRQEQGRKYEKQNSFCTEWMFLWLKKWYLLISAVNNCSVHNKTSLKYNTSHFVQKTSCQPAIESRSHHKWTAPEFIWGPSRDHIQLFWFVPKGTWHCDTGRCFPHTRGCVICYLIPLSSTCQLLYFTKPSDAFVHALHKSRCMEMCVSFPTFAISTFIDETSKHTIIDYWYWKCVSVFMCLSLI